MVPWRAIFFSVNVSVAIGMVFVIAQWIVSGSAMQPFVLFVGCVMVAPFIAIAIAEWLLFTRRAPRLERPLGVVAGLAGALAVLCFLTNVGEAVMQGSSTGISIWFVFGVVCLCVASYGFWCCWLRVRRRTLEMPRGFSVVSMAP